MWSLALADWGMMVSITHTHTLQESLVSSLKPHVFQVVKQGYELHSCYTLLVGLIAHQWCIMETHTYTQYACCKSVFIQMSDPSAPRVQSFNFFLLIALFLIDHSCIVLILSPHSYKVVFGHSGQTCMNKEP